MPPEKPPRGKLPSATAEPNVSRGPHTPVPGPDAYPTEPPPQAMRVPPPRGYEGPRARLGSRPDEQTLVGSPSPPAERRPLPANPPPPESMRPSPRIEVADDDFGQTVHAKYGKGSFSGPAWVFLVLALVGAAVALTWFVTRNSDGSRPPADDVLVKLNALDAKLDKSNAAQDLHEALVLQRIGALETQNGATQARLDALLRGAQMYPAPPLNVPVSQALSQPHR